MGIDIKKCTVEELVQHFKLKLRGENMYCPSTPTPEQQEILKARKPEIMKFMIARKTKEIQQRQARAAQIDAIPGALRAQSRPSRRCHVARRVC